MKYDVTGGKSSVQNGVADTLSQQDNGLMDRKEYGHDPLQEGERTRFFMDMMRLLTGLSDNGECAENDIGSLLFALRMLLLKDMDPVDPEKIRQGLMHYRNVACFIAGPLKGLLEQVISVLRKDPPKLVPVAMENKSSAILLIMLKLGVEIGPGSEGQHRTIFVDWERAGQLANKGFLIKGPNNSLLAYPDSVEWNQKKNRGELNQEFYIDWLLSKDVGMTKQQLNRLSMIYMQGSAYFMLAAAKLKVPIAGSANDFVKFYLDVSISGKMLLVARQVVLVTTLPKIVVMTFRGDRASERIRLCRYRGGLVFTLSKIAIYENEFKFLSSSIGFGCEKQEFLLAEKAEDRAQFSMSHRAKNLEAMAIQLEYLRLCKRDYSKFGEYALFLSEQLRALSELIKFDQQSLKKDELSVYENNIIMESYWAYLYYLGQLGSDNISYYTLLGKFLTNLSSIGADEKGCVSIGEAFTRYFKYLFTYRPDDFQKTQQSGLLPSTFYFESKLEENIEIESIEYEAKERKNRVAMRYIIFSEVMDSLGSVYRTVSPGANEIINEESLSYVFQLLHELLECDNESDVSEYLEAYEGGDEAVGLIAAVYRYLSYLVRQYVMRYKPQEAAYMTPEVCFFNYLIHNIDIYIGKTGVDITGRLEDGHTDLPDILVKALKFVRCLGGQASSHSVESISEQSSLSAFLYEQDFIWQKELIEHVKDQYTKDAGESNILTAFGEEQRHERAYCLAIAQVLRVGDAKHSRTGRPVKEEAGIVLAIGSMDDDINDAKSEAVELDNAEVGLPVPGVAPTAVGVDYYFLEQANSFYHTYIAKKGVQLGLESSVRGGGYFGIIKRYSNRLELLVNKMLDEWKGIITSAVSENAILKSVLMKEVSGKGKNGAVRSGDGNAVYNHMISVVSAMVARLDNAIFKYMTNCLNVGGVRSAQSVRGCRIKLEEVLQGLHVIDELPAGNTYLTSQHFLYLSQILQSYAKIDSNGDALGVMRELVFMRIALLPDDRYSCLFERLMHLELDLGFVHLKGLMNIVESVDDHPDQQSLAQLIDLLGMQQAIYEALKAVDSQKDPRHSRVNLEKASTVLSNMLRRLAKTHFSYFNLEMELQLILKEMMSSYHWGDDVWHNVLSSIQYYRQLANPRSIFEGNISDREAAELKDDISGLLDAAKIKSLVDGDNTLLTRLIFGLQYVERDVMISAARKKVKSEQSAVLCNDRAQASTFNGMGSMGGSNNGAVPSYMHAGNRQSSKVIHPVYIQSSLSRSTDRNITTIEEVLVNRKGVDIAASSEVEFLCQSADPIAIKILAHDAGIICVRYQLERRVGGGYGVYQRPVNIRGDMLNAIKHHIIELGKEAKVSAGAVVSSSIKANYLRYLVSKSEPVKSGASDTVSRLGYIDLQIYYVYRGIKGEDALNFSDLSRLVRIQSVLSEVYGEQESKKIRPFVEKLQINLNKQVCEFMNLDKLPLDLFLMKLRVFYYLDLFLLKAKKGTLDLDVVKEILKRHADNDVGMAEFWQSIYGVVAVRVYVHLKGSMFFETRNPVLLRKRGGESGLNIDNYINVLVMGIQEELDLDFIGNLVLLEKYLFEAVKLFSKHDVIEALSNFHILTRAITCLEVGGDETAAGVDVVISDRAGGAQVDDESSMKLKQVIGLPLKRFLELSRTPDASIGIASGFQRLLSVREVAYYVVRYFDQGQLSIMLQTSGQGEYADLWNIFCKNRLENKLYHCKRILKAMAAESSGAAKLSHQLAIWLYKELDSVVLSFNKLYSRPCSTISISTDILGFNENINFFLGEMEVLVKQYAAMNMSNSSGEEKISAEQLASSVSWGVGVSSNSIIVTSTYVSFLIFKRFCEQIFVKLQTLLPLLNEKAYDSVGQQISSLEALWSSRKDGRSFYAKSIACFKLGAKLSEKEKLVHSLNLMRISKAPINNHCAVNTPNPFSFISLERLVERMSQFWEDDGPRILPSLSELHAFIASIDDEMKRQTQEQALRAKEAGLIEQLKFERAKRSQVKPRTYLEAGLLIGQRSLSSLSSEAKQEEASAKFTVFNTVNGW